MLLPFSREREGGGYSPKTMLNKTSVDNHVQFALFCGCYTCYTLLICIYCIVQVLIIYRFRVVVFMAGAATKAGDADSSWAPGLTSDFHCSTNVH